MIFKDLFFLMTGLFYIPKNTSALADVFVLRRNTCGHNTYGYDYFKKTPTSPPRLVINKKEAKVVKFLFTEYAKGVVDKVITFFQENQVEYFYIPRFI